MSSWLRSPSASLAVWSGRLFLWPGRALYVGFAAETTLHTHHAIQACLGLDGVFRLRRGSKARWNRFHSALVEADQPHQLDGTGIRVALLYLDPESDDGQALSTIAEREGRALQLDRTRARLRERLLACGNHASAAIAADAVEELLRTLMPVKSPKSPLDPRVNRILANLRASSDFRPSAAEAASLVALSSHRFQHVFRASTGVPFRRYLLWLRLIGAVNAAASGASLTDAAYAAGFSDSAHLSRTFRRMFGLAPSDLTKHSEFVQAAGRSTA